MSNPKLTFTVLFIVFALVAGSGAAHSPVDAEDGRSPETATEVEDPAKSWAIYGHLDGPGDVQYFSMDLDEGDRLYLSVLSTEEDFVPDLVVMGPGWEVPANGSLDLEVPEGYGWVLVEGEAEGADFEPFTPGSYYHVAVYDEEVEVAGTYYAAVVSEEGEGPFSIAVGYLESFTLVEWLSLPVSLLGIYSWEGQGWALILGPALIVIVGGLVALLWFLRRQERALSMFQWTSAISGLFILAWAATVLTQMTMALAKSGWSGGALVSMGFAAGSVLMARYALVPAFSGPEVPDTGRRMGMVLVGLVALGLYSGLYVGPVLAFVAAVMPASMAAMTPGLKPKASVSLGP
ncbi:MAG: hypothetical protein JSW25_00150 [Thermoplasmata archaeon]|nr:MAG: hypothetical protein JSW25_00150 [Thermoplasmata archaeon]